MHSKVPIKTSITAIDPEFGTRKKNGTHFALPVGLADNKLSVNSKTLKITSTTPTHRAISKPIPQSLKEDKLPLKVYLNKFINYFCV